MTSFQLVSFGNTYSTLVLTTMVRPHIFLLVVLFTVIICGFGLFFIWMVIKKKYLHFWLGSYMRRKRLTLYSGTAEPFHVLFCLADHFEPGWGKSSFDVQVKRVKQWCDLYPKMALVHSDSTGRVPQHSFFFPVEEYVPETLDLLAQLCKAGFGDVEIHLHHYGDTPEAFRERITRFKNTLFRQHGLLRKDPVSGQVTYGFIHGNWALDNSRKDGYYCGLDNEIQLLRETGCYADFTMPSAPSDTQSAKINSIYYAKDDPFKPKSYNTGIDAEVGRTPYGDLLLIQGPLALNWKKRKFNLLPKIENGCLCVDNPPTPDRIDLWIKQHIHVRHASKWIIVKVYTHGAQERNMAALLNGDLDKMYRYLETRYNDGKNYVLHYVTAWELYNIVKAAEHGHTGNPSCFFQYLVTGLEQHWTEGVSGLPHGGMR